MLVTTRKFSDKIYISSDLYGEVTLHIIKADNGEVSFAIDAPKNVNIHSTEPSHSRKRKSQGE